MPCGSRPLPGSSRISTGGSPIRAAASPRRWRMPSEYAPACRLAASARPTCSSISSTRAVGDAGGVGQDPQVVAPAASGVEGVGLDHRARRFGPGRAAPGNGDPPIVAPPRFGGGEVEHDLHGRRLPGTVRPEEAGHATWWHRETQVVDDGVVAIALGDVFDLQRVGPDGWGGAPSGRSGRAGRG